MAEEDSLRLWASAACADVFESDSLDGGAGLDVAAVHSLGRFIFALPEDSPADAVLEEIAAHIGQETLPDELTGSLAFLVEATLICAVSSACVDRARFVQGIMGLDATAQQHIMQAIKNNLQHYFAAEEEEEEEEDQPSGPKDGAEDGHGEKEDEEVSACADTPQPELLPPPPPLPMAAAPPSSSSSTAMIGACGGCEEKALALQRATDALDALTRRERETEAKFQAEMAAQTNKLIDAELIILTKDEQLGERAAELAEAAARLRESQDKAAEAQRAVHALQACQDEIDVLRPRAERADAAEQQMEKLRSRLDDVKSVRTQLREEADAHATTHAKLLAAEQELETLRRAKAQVEEYRAQCAEVAIRADELALRLRQRDDLVRRLESELAGLRGDQHDQREHAELLSAELRAAEEQLREGSVRDAGGIGEAMCELNPALMQELQKLRADNAELLRKLDATSLEALDALEKSVADQRCVNASLQEKWLGTKDALAHANGTIAVLNSKLALLSLEHVQLQQRAADAAAMADEDRAAGERAHAATLRRLREVDGAQRALAARGQACVWAAVRAGWHATETALTEETQTLAARTAERDEVAAALVAAQEAHAAEQAGRAADREAAARDADQAAEELRQAVARAEAQHEERVRQLEERHEEALRAETERTCDAAAELDGERSKRRRVEREKKFFETETHRLKTQLTVTSGGGASGQDIEDALKELKAMQQQLDDARAEIAILRSHGPYEDTAGRQTTVVDAATGAAAAAGAAGGIRGAALRPQRLKPAERDGVSTRGGAAAAAAAAGCTSASSSSSGAGGAGGSSSNSNSSAGGTYGGYLEQVEVADKRVEQLMRERRELIAKNLEENKEKIDLSQKLMLSEKECGALKSRVTKLQLEKERMERRMANMSEASSSLVANTAKRTRSQLVNDENEF